MNSSDKQISFSWLPHEPQSVARAKDAVPTKEVGDGVGVTESGSRERAQRGGLSPLHRIVFQKCAPHAFQQWESNLRKRARSPPVILQPPQPIQQPPPSQAEERENPPPEQQEMEKEKESTLVRAVVENRKSTRTVDRSTRQRQRVEIEIDDDGEEEDGDCIVEEEEEDAENVDDEEEDKIEEERPEKRRRSVRIPRQKERREKEQRMEAWAQWRARERERKEREKREEGIQFCRCGAERSTGTLVQCALCKRWSHLQCISHTRAQVRLPSFQFYCFVCRVAIESGAVDASQLTPAPKKKKKPKRVWW